MKITRIDSFILHAPLGKHTFWSSQCSFAQRKSLLVRIETDNGLVGWGEGGQYGPAEPVASMVHDVFAPLLLGTNPLQVSVHWERLYASIRDFGRKGAAIEALSALDIALWDVCGHFYQQPISSLLGGRFREQVPCYATGLYYRGEQIPSPAEDLIALADETAFYLERGFEAIKMKIGLYSPAQDIRRVERVREIIGPDRLLMVDANHAYAAHSAAHIMTDLQQLDVFWFEEPVVPEDRDGYARLRNKEQVAIAGGECEYTRYGFADCFRSGMFDICQPDLCCAGGISEVKRIAELASSYHVRCIPHVWGSAVALAAGLQLLSTLPALPGTAHLIPGWSIPLLEWDCNPNPLRTDLLAEDIMPTAGSCSVPTGPGLGIHLDLQRVTQFTTATRSSS